MSGDGADLSAGVPQVTCRHCGQTFEGPTLAMALKTLGKHASEGYQ